tara:strand:+ start:25478 stop:26020 length:543 start_codon:yes stop_codon:yes gene_type:complete
MKNNQIITIINSILIVSGISILGSYWIFLSVEKYNHGLLFILALVFSGIVTGLSIISIIKHFRPNLLAIKNKSGYGLTHTVLLVSIILISNLGTIINELNPKIIEVKTFEISHFEKETFVGKGSHRDTYYAYVFDPNNDFEKVIVPGNFQEYNPNVDSITITINKGKLGFKYYCLAKETD